MTYATPTDGPSSESTPGAGRLSAGRSLIARAAVAAEGTLNVEAMSAHRLITVAFWHECPIARYEAEAELARRGVKIP